MAEINEWEELRSKYPQLSDSQAYLLLVMETCGSLEYDRENNRILLPKSYTKESLLELEAAGLVKRPDGEEVNPAGRICIDDLFLWVKPETRSIDLF